MRYWRNWRLYLCGFRWIFTRNLNTYTGDAVPNESVWIRYKPHWGPWRFLLPYCTTYLLGVLFGCGVVSLSRWWWERSIAEEQFDVLRKGFYRTRYPFSRFMTRALNWAFPGSRHGRETGPRLWRSKDLWE